MFRNKHSPKVTPSFDHPGIPTRVLTRINSRVLNSRKFSRENTQVSREKGITLDNWRFLAPSELYKYTWDQLFYFHVYSYLYPLWLKVIFNI